MPAAVATDPLSGCRALEHPAGYAVDIPVAGQVYRVPIPKDRAANRRWRRALIERGDDVATRPSVLALCAAHDYRACLYWINAFGWTFLQQTIDADGRQHALTSGGVDVPMITWVVQDEIVERLVYAIENGRDVAVDKSRDMGLTWLIAFVFVWYVLFRPGCNFMAMSRVEELVDNAGDPDSIFWKVDYIINALPGWMVPPRKRTYLKMIFEELRTSIVGKSTTPKQGRAGRKTAVLLDEAGFMDGLRPIWVSLGQTTSTRIANSTAAGPGFFSKLIRSPQVLQVRAMWWDHPMKGRGRYLWTDPQTGEKRIRSPWYDQQRAKAVDDMEYLQELDADHGAAGFSVFPDRILNQQESMYAQEPLYVGDLVYTTEDELQLDLALRRGQLGVDLFEFLANDRSGGWRIWCDLEEDDLGNWRPPQDRTYIMGADPSYGQGKADSAIYVRDLETEEQIAEYTSNRSRPEAFARELVKAGYWFGGARGCAFLGWEANGPGGTVGEDVVKSLRYPWWYRMIDEKRRTKRKTEIMGWWSNDQSKKDLLIKLGGAWGRGLEKTRSARVLAQAREYTFYENGGIGPGDKKGEDPRELHTHGDLVIAAGVANYISKYAHRCSPPERIALPGSPAFRRQQAENDKRRGRRP